MSILEQVKKNYSAVAQSTLSNDNAGVRAVAQAFGYSADELASIPAAANMGLSCGNPTAMASLKPGETVVDLGSGGGLDVFLAARKVGPTGRAIGIDMTPSMVERAKNAAHADGYTNVEFHLATIDHLPLPAHSADCIISNCVINLAPDKPAVFREIFRILKPGGRVAVSDIALKQPLPPELAGDIMAYIGCIAGAILIDDYVAALRAAGFTAVHVVDAHADLNAYAAVDGQSACCAPPMERASVSLNVKDSSCCGTTASGNSCCTPAPAHPAKGSAQIHRSLADLLSRYNVNDYAASVKVFALKPESARDK